MRYGKFNDEGVFEWAPDSLKQGNTLIIHPDDADYVAAGYLPVFETTPNEDSHIYKYEQIGGVIRQVWDGIDVTAILKGEVE